MTALEGQRRKGERFLELHAKAIVDATDLPVVADLENGYGDAPEAAATTIRLAGTARSGSLRTLTYANVNELVKKH